MSEELRAAAARYTEARIALLAARDVQTELSVRLAAEQRATELQYIPPEDRRAAVLLDERMLRATEAVRECLIELIPGGGRTDSAAGPAGARQCGATRMITRIDVIERLRFLRWLFERQQLGGPNDGADRERAWGAHG